MNDELDKLAAAMKNIRPSKAARKHGMKAAMAAFDTEFASEASPETIKETEAVIENKSQTSQRSDQGLTVTPRPTEQTTHSATRIERVLFFGRDTMTNVRKIINIKPKTLMMGGTCIAALLVSLVFFQTDQFGTKMNPPADPSVIIIAENIPDIPSVPTEVPKTTTTKSDTAKSDAAKSDAAKSDTTKSDTVEVPATITPPPVVKVSATRPVPTPKSEAATSTETPSNVVVIERRVLKYPASTQERAIPAITKTVSRRVIKTPARTEERITPEVTKEVTRHVKAEDGTLKTVTETVVVQASSPEYITIPAEYETITETVVVQEASTELVTVPASYETVRETIEINADGSTNVLKSETVPPSGTAKSSGGIGTINSLLSIVRPDAAVSDMERRTRKKAYRSRSSRETSALSAPRDEIIVTGAKRSVSGLKPAPVVSSGWYASGEASDVGAGVLSLPELEPAPEATKAPTHTVERVIPAVTKQVTRRVVRTPASSMERIIPAVTKKVTVRVKTEDGTYKNVTKTFVIQEASTEYITIPPVYETITETVVVTEASTELVVLNADGSVVKPKPVPKPVPQSGRLTAGDYDDVLNPDLYKVYLDKTLQGRLKGKNLPYVDANKRIALRVVDRHGKAVPMADISLEYANSEKMFPLRTGADGMAYLYPNYDVLKPGVKITISTKGARTVKKNLSKKLIKNGGEIVVKLKTGGHAVESLDLLLTIDATGSMSDEMRYLQSELQAIIGRVEEANPGIDIRTGLIVYRDKGDQYVVREIPFTDDLEDFRKSLGKQNATGGGDMPEAMHTAMQAGLKMDWRKDALKINLLVADAPPHNQYISDTWDTGLISRSRGIHIVPLAASGVDKTAEFLMRSMAQITGGRYLFLTDDSGIGNSHAEPTVDCYVVTRLDGLLTRVIDSLIKGERVEPKTDDIIRSVGNYQSGICAVNNPEPNVSPQTAALRDERNK